MSHEIVGDPILALVMIAIAILACTIIARRHP
jgi:hypothetical protein